VVGAMGVPPEGAVGAAEVKVRGGEVRRVNWLLSIKCSIIFYYHNHLLSMW
jgi:hypothetical protein